MINVHIDRAGAVTGVTHNDSHIQLNMKDPAHALLADLLKSQAGAANPHYSPDRCADLMAALIRFLGADEDQPHIAQAAREYLSRTPLVAIVPFKQPENA